MLFILRAILIVCAAACLATAPAIAGDATSAVTGIWITGKGESQIEIQPCSDGLCGRIVQVLKPDPGASPYDVNNPDPAMRNRPVVGLTILSGLKPTEDNDAVAGSVYNPRDGETYAVTLTPKGDTMDVEGCVAYILCDTQKWKRVVPAETATQ